jgi:hypothetical protein
VLLGHPLPASSKKKIPFLLQLVSLAPPPATARLSRSVSPSDSGDRAAAVVPGACGGRGAAGGGAGREESGGGGGGGGEWR